MKTTFLLGIFGAAGLWLSAALSQPSSKPPQPANVEARLRVPPGFVVERVASPPLVEHPMMGGFDEEGRLFLAESAGQNLKKDDLLKVFPNFVRMLEPADAKGVFRASRVWADKMSFPMGAFWHQGGLYTGSPPSLWRLEDSRGQGIADRRTEVVSKFGFTGNAADIHGPFLGPDGRLYWCDGRHGHEIQQPDGTKLQGKAARIFRCKSDGSEVEVICGGGMDNPVEIAFTPECEPLVTVDILHAQPARNDGIIFAIEGGVYPWHDVYKEFPRTGELLPAVGDLGWVAPSGLMRLRSAAFGKEYQGNLFSAQFNRNRIQRHVVERHGAAFKLKTEDFLVSDDKNFHPTDVLEDADGSLLVIDTGGWFRIGCPTSKIAQPEIKGAIYRVRKKDAPLLEDPRGLKIAWKKITPTELTALLDDPRFMVRDRAIEELATLGKESLAALRKVLTGSPSSLAVRNAVWALTRLDIPAARTLVRQALADKDLSVRLAAIHSAGLYRDEKALPKLQKLVDTADAATRRQAATALGRIKSPDAVPAVMEAIKAEAVASGRDRFLEHALLYALIQINDADSVEKYLSQPSPAMQRAALIALDQMTSGKLTREQVTPLLATGDPALLQSVLGVIAARPDWGSEIVGLLRGWLAEKDLPPARRESVRGLVVSLAPDKAVQELVVEALQKNETAISARVVLLESIARSSLAKLPEAWAGELGRGLEHDDARVVQQAVAGVRERGLSGYDPVLQKLAGDKNCAADLRVSAFAAVAPRQDKVDAEVFAFLVEQVHPEKSPLQRLAVAGALGKTQLTAEQLTALVKVIAAAGPLEMPHLLAPFEKAGTRELGEKLVAALEKSPGLGSVTPASLEKTLEKYPEEVKAGAKKLLARLSQETSKQRARLVELEGVLQGGDPVQGRDLFFGPKASCAACHAVGGKGGNIGPELSKIGAIRAGRDLLESLVFPSASYARGYESFVVETRAGQLHTGILRRETPDAVYLVTAERNEIRIGRDNIEILAPGKTSIMPQGLDTQLSRAELRDLLGYLQLLR